MNPPDVLEILYAEDDPDDRFLAGMAHRESGIANPLVFVEDGQQALEYLRRTGRYGGRPGVAEPGLILLDLNMPGINGHETLRVIRADPLLCRIPVVILTTSSAPSDLAASHQAGANAHVVKPIDFVGLVQVFTQLHESWFDGNALAPELGA